MKRIFSLVVIILFAASFAHSAEVPVPELVDQYKHATDLQRQILEQNFIGKVVTGNGIIENVGEYDFFDVTNDISGKYYKVLARQQETPNKTPYQIVFLFKDKSKLLGLNRGEPIEKEGTIMKIIDERLQIAVWIYEGELTPKELDLFK